VDTTIIGDRAYYATETDEGVLGVVAAEASSGKKLWVSTEAGLATGWDQIVGLPDGLVAITDVDSGSDTKRLVVLDRESGQARWQHSMKGSDSVVLAGGNAIFLDTDGKRLVAMRIGDGGKAWELADPGGSSRVPALLSSSTTDDVSGPARVSGAPLAPDRDDDTRLLQVMGDRSARVIDARNGTVLTEPKADIADVDGAVVVHNGRVVVAEKSGETLRIMTYDLDGLANPKVIGQVGKDQRVERMSACGDDHVCWIETTSYDAKTSQVAGVNVADGGKIWRVAAPNAETLAAVGDNVLVNQGSQPARVMLVDATTGKAAWSGEGAGARLDGGNVLLFSRPLATSVEDPSLIGRHLGDKPVQLGPLTGVRTASCSWNTSAIACVADEDLRWQKIAS
jgi:outer membrane protein assembly factor BamB